MEEVAPAEKKQDSIREVEEDPISDAFFTSDKIFILMTNSGKPIYSRYHINPSLIIDQCRRYLLALSSHCNPVCDDIKVADHRHTSRCP